MRKGAPDIWLRRLGHDIAGAASVEYALLLVAIAMAIALAINTLGNEARSVFRQVAASIPPATALFSERDTGHPHVSPHHAVEE